MRRTELVVRAEATMTVKRTALGIFFWLGVMGSTHAQNFGTPSGAPAGTRFTPMPISTQPVQQLPPSAVATGTFSPAPANLLAPTSVGLSAPSPVPGSLMVPPPGPSDMLVSPISGVPAYSTGSPNYSATLAAGSPFAGPITYDLYVRNGPSFLLGRSAWTDVGLVGWNVGAGFRTLFFNPTADAAWVLDLGVGFTRNGGKLYDAPIDIRAGSLKFGNPSDDSLISLAVQGISRTTFNFGLGRDWWLNGPGVVGMQSTNNWNAGVDVGGRWGTASVGFMPMLDPTGFRRRQGVVHGVYLGSHLNWEKPFGNFVLFAGLRAEWGYTWTNLLPPSNADISEINLLMQFGVRY